MFYLLKNSYTHLAIPVYIIYFNIQEFCALQKQCKIRDVDLFITWYDISTPLFYS